MASDEWWVDGPHVAERRGAVAARARATDRPAHRSGGRGTRRIVHLAQLDLSLPALPVLLVELHEALGPFERLGPGPDRIDGIATHDLLGLREWPVGHRQPAAGQPDP